MLPQELLPQAITILQVMGASTHMEAANVILAQFASREMSETDAERAVLAAFDLLSAKQQHPRSGEFDLRIGIASGFVWTRTAADAGSNFSNLVTIQASLLREHASPGSVYITEATRDFVKALFAYADREPLIFRNFPEPVRAFGVVRPSETEDRFEALHSQRLRFLGREREFSHLANLWGCTCGGKGQIAFITGERGIGKSRLVTEAGHRLGPMPVARLRLFGSPNHQNSELYPFVRLTERLCGLARTAPPSVKKGKTRGLLNLNPTWRGGRK
jgi:AAA ATPase domain